MTIRRTASERIGRGSRRPPSEESISPSSTPPTPRRAGRAASERVGGRRAWPGPSRRAGADHPDDVLESRRPDRPGVGGRRRPPAPSRASRTEHGRGRRDRRTIRPALLSRGGRVVRPADLARQPADRLLCVDVGQPGRAFLGALTASRSTSTRTFARAREISSCFPRGRSRDTSASVNRVTDHLVRRGARVVRDADPPGPRLRPRPPRGPGRLAAARPAARGDAGPRGAANARRRRGRRASDAGSPRTGSTCWTTATA